MVFADTVSAAVKDRYAYFKGFYANFYTTDENLGIRVSDEVAESSWNVATSASGYASVAAIITWTSTSAPMLPRSPVTTPGHDSARHS